MSVTNTEEVLPLVRKAVPGAVVLAVVTVAGMVALNVWWATITPGLLLYSFPPLAATVLALVHNLRYRVILDEDGIRVRGLTGEESVPWQDVTGVRAAAGTEGTVVVGRQDALPLVLRELPVAAGTDELVTELRERAGRPSDEPEGEWYVGRPSRLPLVWAFPVLAASVALVFLPVWGLLEGFGAGTAFAVGVAGIVYHVRLILLLLYGRTEAGPTGLYNRSAVATRRMGWSQVQRLEVVRSPFGRRVVAVTDTGPKTALAAPREGLLTRGPAFDGALNTLLTTAPKAPEVRRRAQPRLLHPALAVLAVLALLWGEDPRKEPWWPTRHEATSLPDPCAVADQATVRRTVPDPQPPDRQDHTWFGYDESTCQWHQTGLSIGLRIELRRYLRNGDDGATEEAARQMRTARAQATGTVTGLGDEAFRRDDDGDGIRTREIWARRANVTVHIELTGKDPADLDALARRALDSVELR